MKRKLVATTLVAMMVASLAGCGSSSDSSSSSESTASSTKAASGETKDASELKLAFIVGTENDAFYQSVEDGISARCDELGIPKPTLADQQLDGSVCTDLINNYVAAGYDAVALSCNDPAGTVPAIEQAIASLHLTVH